jgi:hypothetical protein
MSRALSVIWYWAAQTVGFRRHYFSGVSYKQNAASPGYIWLWIPKIRKGTYWELRKGWRYVGYGSHL